MEVQVHAWLNVKPPQRAINCNINIWSVLATNIKQEITQASVTPAMTAMVPPLRDYTIKKQSIFSKSVNFFWSRCITESLRKPHACQHPNTIHTSISKTTKNHHIRQRLRTKTLNLSCSKADPSTEVSSFPLQPFPSQPCNRFLYLFLCFFFPLGQNWPFALKWATGCVSHVLNIQFY